MCPKFPAPHTDQQRDFRSTNQVSEDYFYEPYSAIGPDNASLDDKKKVSNAPESTSTYHASKNCADTKEITVLQSKPHEIVDIKEEYIVENKQIPFKDEQVTIKDPWPGSIKEVITKQVHIPREINNVKAHQEYAIQDKEFQRDILEQEPNKFPLLDSSCQVLEIHRAFDGFSVEGKICNKEVSFFIDTGAAVSSISADFYQPFSNTFPLNTASVPHVRAVNDAKLNVLGQVEIPIKLGEYVYPFVVLVVGGLTFEAILGRDFMTRFPSKIDLLNNTIAMASGISLCPLSDMDLEALVSTDEVSSKVQAACSVILPPNSETIVSAYVPFPSETIGIIDANDTFTERYQVVSATQLVKVSEQGLIPVRLLNLNLHPINIFQNTSLATFVATEPEIATYNIEIAKDLSRSTETPEVKPEQKVDTSSDFQDTISPDLTEIQQSQLTNLLQKYRDVFAFTSAELGRTDLVQHTIDTGDSPPVRQRPYRTSPVNRQEIDRQVEEMLEQGIIDHSTSPWSSPVVLVKKSDGTMRFCVDYRQVNARTIRDSFPLPLIADTLDALSGTQFFTTLDLRSGYWQIEVHPESREKTAFITHSGLYQFRVLPFGLTNAPSSFQRLMGYILRGLHYKTALIYLDDVIIFSRSFDDHLLHLEQVFQRLRDANVKLKPSKCHFAQTSVEYLGHIVSREGIKPNPAKIEAVKSFPVPSSVTQVKSFLGLCNYYRRFVSGFARIANPLNHLTKKGVQFKWTPVCQDAFEKLKEALISSPILAYPDFELPFHVMVDASAEGIGFCLAQYQRGKEVAIAYGGRDLSPAERNYSATEREALALVVAIRKFQPYLYGRKFTVHTDHNALKWLMGIKNVEGRLARWSLLIQQYDFDIQHRAGKSNGNADGLSRRHYGTFSMNAIGNSPFQGQRIVELQRRDTELADIISYLEHDVLPPDDTRARKILLSNDSFFLGEHGILYHIDHNQKKGTQGPVPQLVIPTALKYEVLVNAHDDATGGHLGTTKTYGKVRARYWWNGMFADVSHWCKSCVDCSTRKTPRNRHKAPLLPIPVGGAFERVAVDCLGPFPVSRSGNRYITVFCDYLTKWVEAFATPTVEAHVIARLLIDEIICRHGAPRYLLSDRGTNFLSKLVLEVCKLYGIRKLSTTAFHPATDGLVERFNSTLAQSLSMYVSRDHKDWDTCLPSVLFAYRVSPSEVTGDTPFYLLYGREVTLPIDVSLLPPPDPSSSIAEHRARIVRNIEISQRVAKENIQRAQQKMKAYYDQNAREPKFEIGQRVWVYTPKVKPGLSKKLLHRWHGPYRIVNKLSPVHYHLKNCANKPVETNVHANRMKIYYDPSNRPILPPEVDDAGEPYLVADDLPDDSFQSSVEVEVGDVMDKEPVSVDAGTSKQADVNETQEANSEDQNYVIDNESIFSVEKLLKKRQRKGRTEYLVKWANYPIKKATWEPSENILNKRLIEQFDAAHA